MAGDVLVPIAFSDVANFALLLKALSETTGLFTAW